MWMQSDNVLEVDGLSKLYSRVQSSSQKRLVETFGRVILGRQGKTPYELRKGEFWSLKNISFSVRRGEALGVIGFNGAGKTTLLRLLAGQILPDAGEIRVLGRTAAMIDLAAGFQMTASGRRNIDLLGALLGRSKDEINSSYDEIVDFAELGDAIDAPVATYSSGMKMRLAFSIMVSMKPDVLFIDEILSVGDFRFKQKCLARIREMRKKAAFVLVSHNMEDISRFCNHAIVLERGCIGYEGEPDEATKYYLAQTKKTNVTEKTSVREEKINKATGHFFHNENSISDIEHYWADRKGNVVNNHVTGEELFFVCKFNLKHKVRHLTIGVPIWSEEGQYITGFASINQFDGVLPNNIGINKYLLEIPQLGINPGMFHSNVVIRDGPEYLYRQPNEPLKIESMQKRHFGAVEFQHNWRCVGL